MSSSLKARLEVVLAFLEEAEQDVLVENTLDAGDELYEAIQMLKYIIDFVLPKQELVQ